MDRDIDSAQGPDAFARFLQALTLTTDRDEAERGAEKDEVGLLTLHSAKGLEFAFVFLAGIGEDLLPHANAVAEGHAGIEEERRLFYVSARALRARGCGQGPGAALEGGRDRALSRTPAARSILRGGHGLDALGDPRSTCDARGGARPHRSRDPRRTRRGGAVLRPPSRRLRGYALRRRDRARLRMISSPPASESWAFPWSGSELRPVSDPSDRSSASRRRSPSSPLTSRSVWAETSAAGGRRALIPARARLSSTIGTVGARRDA